MGAKANHHYVPQFYLRNFAEGVGRKARVWFFDDETRSAGQTLVRNVASARYFNRIEAEGYHPDAVEDALAKLESEMVGPLAEVIKVRDFPSADHFSYVMNLAALLSVRNPSLRGRLEKFHQRIADKMLGMVTSSKEIWESQTRKMKDDGHELSGKVTFEDLRRFREQGQYTIAIDQTHLIGLEFEMIDPVLKTLSNRNWCFATAPEGSQYVTSDNPVCLEWANELSRSTMPVGHGLKGTNLLFPLSSTVLLIGAFEDIPESVLHSEEQVSSVNTIVARNSRRQIYAKNGDFKLNLRNRDAVRGADLPRCLGVD